ncbi:hypothetical protein HMPREF1548_02761 [Clostridium sp. KLE 1755]|nr:hypothetical protein HMPREF1548_02761 [Clostridium sp. KLE 1755]
MPDIYNFPRKKGGDYSAMPFIMWRMVHIDDKFFPAPPAYQAGILPQNGIPGLANLW